LLGALLRGLGQRAHLVGDHGEALAMLPGARRFDGRIQGQQIRLVGDARDGLDDVADGCRLLFQFGDHFHRHVLSIGGQAHVLHQVATSPLVLTTSDCTASTLAWLTRILHLAGDGSFHLLERDQGFLSGAGGFFGAGRDLFRVALQLLGGGGGLVDAGRQLSRGGRHPLRRLLLLGERPRLFALRVGVASRCARRFAGVGSRDQAAGNDFLISAIFLPLNCG
jgi:hypothetical protein